MQIPFVGPAYTDRSVNVNAQRCVNLFPEINDAGGKNNVVLYGTPGLELFVNVSANPVRGMYAFKDYLYVVSYNKFYEIRADGVVTEKGTLSTTSGRVSMADNGNQLMIVDGAYGYIYDASNNTFQQIGDPDFPGANQVVFLDGYFIINKPNTGSFMISALYDGTSWNALDIATAEGDPDNLVALVNDHRQLWLFGKYSTEVFYNSGNADFPFERISGVFIEWGCVAPWSVAKLDNSIFWLAQNKYGQGVVVRADGYQPRIISTRAIEYQIAQYSTISDAFAFAYMDEGHAFYVLTFPTGNATWVYDAATGMWHERSSYNVGRWRVESYAYFNGFHMVGDFSNGNIYKMKMDVYSENGATIERIRTTRHIFDGDYVNVFHHRLQVDMETGVGLASGQGSDPQAMLDWSDDGGHTWSSEVWGGIGSVPVGGTGEYKKRLVWRRLGRSRDRIYRLKITDPVKVVIIGASLEVERGRH